MAKKEKQPVHKVQMTEGKRQIIQQLLQEYDIETAEDIREALKDLLGGTIKEMMEAEMDDHLGYGKLSESLILSLFLYFFTCFVTEDRPSPHVPYGGTYPRAGFLMLSIRGGPSGSNHGQEFRGCS